MEDIMTDIQSEVNEILLDDEDVLFSFLDDVSFVQKYEDILISNQKEELER